MSKKCASAVTMDLNMSIIDDNHKLDRILESTNLDKYELINLTMEEPGDLLNKHMGVRVAPILDTGSTWGLASREGSSMELCLGVDLCQGFSLSLPFHVRTSSRLQACSSDLKGA